MEREEAMRERVLVVSIRRCAVRFLYLLFDDGPRPSEYGTRAAGWGVLSSRFPPMLFCLAAVVVYVAVAVLWSVAYG